MDNKDWYIDLFSAVGAELERFAGNIVCDQVIERAIDGNPWFSERDIITAARALSGSMLDRGILEEWLSDYHIGYDRPEDVAVIMAGNIPFAGFFDMMCVVLSGNRCYAKTSSKDNVLMDYSIGLVNKLAGEEMVLPFDDCGKYRAVIASGSDNSNRYFRARFAGIPSLLRDSRYSVAVLTGDETDEEIASLDNDIFLYNGLGCRNVSLLFVPADYDIGGLAGRLGGVNPNVGYINNYRQSRAMAVMAGEDYTDGNGFIMKEAAEFPHALSIINFTYYSSEEEIKNWIGDNERRIQCVVSRDGDYLRGVPFGSAQHPLPWDYPDGVDIMGFLTGLH